MNDKINPQKELKTKFAKYDKFLNILFVYKMDRNNSSKIAESKIKDITNSISTPSPTQTSNSHGNAPITKLFCIN